jgi:hypothetical protein
MSKRKYTNNIVGSGFKVIESNTLPLIRSSIDLVLKQAGQCNLNNSSNRHICQILLSPNPKNKTTSETMIIDFKTIGNWFNCFTIIWITSRN